MRRKSKQEKQIDEMVEKMNKAPMKMELQGNPGMVVLDEETKEFVQITKNDIENWVKEAITELYKEDEK